MMLVFCLLLGGCSQNSRLQVVVPKEKRERNLTAAESEDSLSEQVQAPERYQSDTTMNGVHILANAKIFVPEVEGIKLKKVQTRRFSEADLTLISEVVFDGAPVYGRDVVYGQEQISAMNEEVETEPAYDKAAESKEYPQAAKEIFAEAETTSATSLKIEKILQSILNQEKEYNSEEIIALGEWCLEMGYNTKDETLKQRLWNNYLVCEELAMSGAPWTKLEISELAMLNYMEGRLFLPGSVGIVQLYNNNSGMTDTGVFFLKRYFEVLVEDVGLARLREQGEEPEAYTNNLLADQTLRSKSDELMNVLGQGNLELAKLEKAVVLSWNEMDGFHHVDPGLMFEYNRVVDGVPITITDQKKGYSVSEDGTLTQWPEEQISAYYDEEGLAAFQWASPIQVEEWQEEYAFLLPFSEIRSIFEEMTINNSPGGKGGYPGTWTVGIQEVRLGYAVVADKEAYQATTNASFSADGTMVYTGILVPAWDFIGTVEGDMADWIGVKQGSRISFMTINAMDGSIIEKAY